MLWAGCQCLCPLLALRYPCFVYDFSLTSLGLHFFTCLSLGQGEDQMGRLLGKICCGTALKCQLPGRVKVILDSKIFCFAPIVLGGAY